MASAERPDPNSQTQSFNAEGTQSDTAAYEETIVNRSEGDSQIPETVEYSLGTANGNNSSPAETCLAADESSGNVRVSEGIKIPGYVNLGELGHGGMGVVYKARQLQADRLVALKVMLDAKRARPEDIARFQTEVRAAASLAHPNIVQVYEVRTDGEYPYFTQEFVPGGTLAERIKDRLLSHRETAESMLQLSQAIAFAHSRGVIHRDLKPSNILVASDGVLKVADFGLARRIDDESQLTRDGTVLGTPSYMAPEQASGSIHKIGPLCDVYALGAILYELLTGRPPFKGATVWEVIQLVRSAEPAAPSSLRPDTPKDLETICLKCLQKDPEKRYASVSALADDLNRHLHFEPILARPIGRVERFVRLCKRHPREASLSGLLVGVLMLVAIGATWAAWQMGKQRNEIAREKEVSDQRLELYRDGVSSMVNSLPQLLEGIPLTQAVRNRLNESAEQLLASQEESADSVGLSQKWGLVGTAIGQGNLLLREAESMLQQGDAAAEVGELLAEADRHFLRAEQVADATVASVETEQAKKLSNLALALSRRAIQRRLIGKPVEAEEFFGRAIELRKQALEVNTTEKPLTQRFAELGRELTNLAELQWEQSLSKTDEGQSQELASQALASLQESRRYFTSAVFDPEGAFQNDASPNTVRDFAMTCELAAKVHQSSGDLSASLALYEEALQLAQKTVELDPDKLSYRLNLASTANKTGDFLLVQRNDPAAARKCFVIAMLELRRIFSDNELQNLYDNGLAMSYYRLGIAAIGQGDDDRATNYFERCALIRELSLRQEQDKPSVKANPDLLLVKQVDLMLAAAQAKQLTIALPMARQLVKRAEEAEAIAGPLQKHEVLMHAAACLGICSQYCEDSQRQSLQTEAIQLIAQALELGHTDLNYLRSDPDFWPLQALPEYKELIQQRNMK